MGGSSFSHSHFPLSFVIRVSSFQSASLRFEHLNERFLRNVNLPDAFHSFLSFFLFLQQLAFPCDIAAVAFRGHIFSQGRNAFPRNNLSADRRLNRDLV